MPIDFSNPLWDRVGNALLVVAVIAGVIATFASFSSSVIQGRISQVAERRARIEMSAAHERIAAAEMVASVAEERAAKANLTSEQARLLSAKAEERATEYAAQAETSKARTAEIELTLERERGERLRLQVELGPRRLPASFEAIIVKSLEGRNIDLQLTILGDSEAGQYAIEIGNILHRSGVKLQIRRVGSMSPPPYGLALFGRGPDFQILAEAFRSSGVAIQIVEGGDLQLLVGLKPPFRPK